MGYNYNMKIEKGKQGQLTKEIIMGGTTGIK